MDNEERQSVNLREQLEADIAEAGHKIEAFNTHFLNHKHLVNGFAVVIMGLIFLGMLIPSIELAAWITCGVLIVAFVATMAYRTNLAKRLDVEMEAAHKAFKQYERGRRKKK